ncbi:putative tetratricopeptide-like helical domain superfamily [Helianthus annuus]|nr:putative tetratricopeptide-like helical domain superfamily [Helianthus annuus]KAJ0670221.1 putative tetratricopeptide-like helical domain superfamily [Helianthus annuus]
MAMAAYLSRMFRLSTTQQTPLRNFSSSSTSHQSFRALKSAIKSEQDPLKIAKLFDSPISIPTFRHYKPLFTLSVHKLTRSKRFDLIDRILSKSITDSPALQLASEGFWLRIVMLYSQAGMVDNALKVFDEMLQRKTCTLTEKSLCGVLSVMLDNKIYDDKFHQTYETFVKKTGVSPGVKSFNLVLNAHVKAGRVDQAQELVTEMESKGDVKPDIRSYNILLGGYLDSGKKSAFDTVNKECARARKLLDEMISKGVEPDSSSYNAIIFGFCKVGDLESARKVLEKMVSDGYVKATSFCYFTLMKHMVEEGELDGGLKVCKDIIEKKWVPPFEATKLLVNGLVTDSKADEANEIVGNFKNRLRGSALESWGKIEASLPI